MKSLEIVNKWGTQLEGIKKCIEEDINKGVSWFNYEKLYKYLEDAETIKQDLEVLEILKKYVYLEQQCYDYDWEDGNTWMDYLSIKDIEEIDEHWQEDYKKVKQWLEENENDNFNN